MIIPSHPSRVLKYTVILCTGLFIISTLQAASAQDVSLKLRNQVEAPGKNVSDSEPLPAGTTVLIYREAGAGADKEGRAHTLSNQGYEEREALVDAMTQDSDRVFADQVGKEGETERAYAKTSGDTGIYYVLARAPDGQLFESYVNADPDGYQPGFDRVVSGKMSMGAVPRRDVMTMRKAFEGVAAQNSSEASTDQESRTDSVRRSDDNDSAKERPDGEGGPKDPEDARDADDGFLGNFWYAGLGFFAFLVGGGMGASAMFLVLADRIEEAGSNRDHNRRENIGSKPKLHKKKKTLKAKSAMAAGMHPPKNEERIRDLQAQIKDKDKEIERLKSKLSKSNQQADSRPSGETHAAKHTPSRQPPQSAQPSASPSSPRENRPATSSRERETVGRLFKAWCHQRGNSPMVDRHNMFVRGLSSELQGATSRRIFRENNAAGLVFSENAQDPVEYWLVEYKGQSLLLPQPSKNGFRELGECFEGKNMAPKDVQQVQPAQLKSGARGLTLEKKGRVV